MSKDFFSNDGFEIYAKSGRIFWRYHDKENWRSMPYGKFMIKLAKWSRRNEAKKM